MITTFGQYWMQFLPKMFKKVSLFNHVIIFCSNLLHKKEKNFKVKMQIYSLKNWVQIFFDLYFFTFCGSAASYCSLKVTKPPESFEIEAKYTKDGRKINLNLIYFLCTSPTYPSHCVRWPWNSNEILKGWSIFRSEKLDDHGILMKL